MLKQGYRDDIPLDEALALAVKALGSVGGEGGAPRQFTGKQLEVAVLDRNRAGRVFRRVTGAALDPLLASAQPAPPAKPAADAAATETAAEAEPAAAPEAETGPAESGE